MAKGRKTGGRIKGSKNKATLDKEAAREHYRQRVMARLDPIIEAQMDAAIGAHQFVYTDDKGRFKVIDDPDELRACIAMGKALRLFTRLPNTSAQDSLLNRVLDKPAEQVQKIEVSGEVNVVARLHAARKRLQSR
jgi:hypothetical protein